MGTFENTPKRHNLECYSSMCFSIRFSFSSNVIIKIASIFHGFAKSVIPGFIAWNLLATKPHFQSSKLGRSSLGEDKPKKDAPLVDTVHCH